MECNSEFFFFNDTATTEIYTLSLHDALPISAESAGVSVSGARVVGGCWSSALVHPSGSSPSRSRHASAMAASTSLVRSEEHTSELQSRQYLVCRLLLEKKNKSEIRMSRRTDI